MNRWLLLAMMLLTLTGSAFAQGQQIQNMGGWYRNPQNGDIVDASGNKYVNEAAKDREFAYYPNVFSGCSVGCDTTTVSAPGDSNTVWMDTHNLSRMWLKIHVHFKGAATTYKAVRFAIQVRGGIVSSSDTLNWAPWTMKNDTLAVALGSGQPDTTSWNYRNGYFPGGAANLAAGLNTEMVFTAAANGFHSNGNGEPSTFYVPLCDLRGVYFWAPFTQLRLRVITVIGGGVAINTAASSPSINVDLLGTALR